MSVSCREDTIRTVWDSAFIGSQIPTPELALWLSIFLPDSINKFGDFIGSLGKKVQIWVSPLCAVCRLWAAISSSISWPNLLQHLLSGFSFQSSKPPAFRSTLNAVLIFQKNTDHGYGDDASGYQEPGLPPRATAHFVLRSPQKTCTQKEQVSKNHTRTHNFTVIYCLKNCIVLWLCMLLNRGQGSPLETILLRGIFQAVFTMGRSRDQNAAWA